MQVNRNRHILMSHTALCPIPTDHMKNDIVKIQKERTSEAPIYITLHTVTQLH